MKSHGAMLLVLAVGLLAVAGGAVAAPIKVGRGEIDFDPGAGYCALDPGASEVERLIMESQRKGNAGLNEVLGIFLSCARLDGLRRGREADLGQYGILLVTLVEGEVKPLEGTSRSDFLSRLERSINGGIDFDSYDLDARMEDALEDANEAGGDVHLSNVKQFGVLQRSETALFSGLLIRLQRGGELVEVVGVSGSTLLKGYMIQYTLYAPFEGERTLRSLIADVEPIMGGAAALNDGAAAPTAAEIDDQREGPVSQFSITLVIVSAAAAGIVAIVVGFLRRSR
jgi:hypothetical protein